MIKTRSETILVYYLVSLVWLVKLSTTSTIPNQVLWTLSCLCELIATSPSPPLKLLTLIVIKKCTSFLFLYWVQAIFIYKFNKSFRFLFGLIVNDCSFFIVRVLWHPMSTFQIFIYTTMTTSLQSGLNLLKAVISTLYVGPFRPISSFSPAYGAIIWLQSGLHTLSSSGKESRQWPIHYLSTPSSDLKITR